MNSKLLGRPEYQSTKCGKNNNLLNETKINSRNYRESLIN